MSHTLKDAPTRPSRARIMAVVERAGHVMAFPIAGEDTAAAIRKRAVPYAAVVTRAAALFGNNA